MKLTITKQDSLRGNIERSVSFENEDLSIHDMIGEIDRLLRAVYPEGMRRRNINLSNRTDEVREEETPRTGTARLSSNGRLQIWTGRGWENEYEALSNEGLANMATAPAPSDGFDYHTFPTLLVNGGEPAATPAVNQGTTVLNTNF